VLFAIPAVTVQYPVLAVNFMGMAAHIAHSIDCPPQLERWNEAMSTLSPVNNNGQLIRHYAAQL